MKRFLNKRILGLLLCVVIVLSMSACSSGSVKLTTDNFKDYLSINASVSDCDLEKKSKTVAGVATKSYSGDATVEIEVVNQSGAKFENVKIKCKVYTYVDAVAGPYAYGWEFKTGNQQTGKKPHTDENYKTITITLPYSGEWKTTEKLIFKAYDAVGRSIFSPKELTRCYVEIIDISGTVKK